VRRYRKFLSVTQSSGLQKLFHSPLRWGKLMGRMSPALVSALHISTSTMWSCGRHKAWELSTISSSDPSGSYALAWSSLQTRVRSPPVALGILVVGESVAGEQGCKQGAGVCGRRRRRRGRRRSGRCGTRRGEIPIAAARSGIAGSCTDFDGVLADSLRDERNESAASPQRELAVQIKTK